MWLRQTYWTPTGSFGKELSTPPLNRTGLKGQRFYRREIKLGLFADLKAIRQW